MGMGIKCMGMGVKTWELSPETANSLRSYIVTWSKGSNAGGAIQPEIEQVVLN